MRPVVKPTLIAVVVLWPLAGCGPHGLAPRARLLPLPRLPSVLVRNQEGLKPAGYYLFTEREWRQLDQTPCRFDPRSARAARLYRRGFSNKEIIQACRDVRRYAGDQRFLEQLAVFRRSGLPLASFRKYLESGLSLTDYYNQKQIGGRGLATAGWILTGIGATSLLAIGAVVLGAQANSCPDEEYDCGDDGLSAGLANMGLMGLAVLTLLPGLPMALVGQLRVSRWLRGRLLDEGHVSDLDAFRLRYLRESSRRAVRASVAPMITRGGGGLSFRLQW